MTIRVYIDFGDGSKFEEVNECSPEDLERAYHALREAEDRILLELVHRLPVPESQVAE